MIEFDVDMAYLLEDDELDEVILNDENGEHEPMRFVRERTCEMYRYKNALGFIDEWQCSECGADVSSIADDTPPNFCPQCGAKVVEL